MWISSRISDPVIWESLQTGYRNLFHRPEPIVQLKVKKKKKDTKTQKKQRKKEKSQINVFMFLCFFFLLQKS